MPRRKPKVWAIEIDHQLIKSAISGPGVYVCKACLKTCMSYESQTEPCPKLSVEE